MRDNLAVNELPLLPAQTVQKLTEAASGLLALMRQQS
jgi:hypothetical protein